MDLFSVKSAAGMTRLYAVGEYFSLAFLLHLLWENSQRPLYGQFVSVWKHFPECLICAATGDMLFMLIVYLTAAAVHRDLWWVINAPAFRHPATWITSALVGILLAVSLELWAVYVEGRWAYGGMPLLPIIPVGLTPVLQMIVVPSLTLFLCCPQAKWKPSEL